jgi:hypothetical protein
MVAKGKRKRKNHSRKEEEEEQELEDARRQLVGKHFEPENSRKVTT